MKKILYHGYLFVFALLLFWAMVLVGCKTGNEQSKSLGQMNYLVVWENEEERVDAVFYTRHEAELYVKLFENSHNYKILEKKYYAFLLPNDD